MLHGAEQGIAAEGCEKRILSRPLRMSPFIVAELGASHNGSFNRAVSLIEAAAEAGADAIKLQTFTPERMVEPDTVIASGPWAGRNALELYRECHTPRDWHYHLFECAKGLGMTAFSSVFHPDDVDFLETLGCPMYKISSFEITDIPLIRYAVSKRKPIVVSTGMASYEEIMTVAAMGWEQLTLLKCTSAYPADASDANLLTMVDMGRLPAVDIGLSDHTLGFSVAVAAVALGAVMVEKHLTLSRADGGPDAAFSSEPHEFAAMVKACREAALALGEVRYGPTPSEMSSLPLRRKPGGNRGG